MNKLLYTIKERSTGKAYTVHKFIQVIEFTEKYNLKGKFTLSIKRA